MTEPYKYRDIRPDGTVLQHWLVNPQTGGNAPIHYEPVIGEFWRQVLTDGVWVTVGRVLADGTWRRP